MEDMEDVLWEDEEGLVEAATEGAAEEEDGIVDDVEDVLREDEEGFVVGAAPEIEDRDVL